MNRNQGSNPESPASGFSWLVFGLVFCALMLPASLWLLESERRHFLEEEWPRIAERIEKLGLSIEELVAMNPNWERKQ